MINTTDFKFYHGPINELEKYTTSLCDHSGGDDVEYCRTLIELWHNDMTPDDMKKIIEREIEEQLKWFEENVVIVEEEETIIKRHLEYKS